MIKLIFLFIVILVLLSFGASNPDNVTIKMFPSNLEINLPTYLFFYLTLILGIIISSIYHKIKK